MPTPSVAVVAYPNVSPFHLSVPCILFGDILPGEQLFSLTVCAAEDGPIPAAHLRKRFASHSTKSRWESGMWSGLVR